MGKASFGAAAAAAVSAERLPSGRICPIRWLSERKPALRFRPPPHHWQSPASMNWHSTRRRRADLALASAGAKATASSCLPGYAIHQIAHLNDGRYGNSQSWIAATSTGEWAQIELAGETAVDRVVFSRDRQGQYRDRLAVHFEYGCRSTPPQAVGSTVKAVPLGVACAARPPTPQSAGPLDTSAAALARALEQGDLTCYAFLCEARTCWRVDPTDPAKRVLDNWPR